MWELTRGLESGDFWYPCIPVTRVVAVYVWRGVNNVNKKYVIHILFLCPSHKREDMEECSHFLDAERKTQRSNYWINMSIHVIFLHFPGNQLRVIYWKILNFSPAHGLGKTLEDPKLDFERPFDTKGGPVDESNGRVGAVGFQTQRVLGNYICWGLPEGNLRICCFFFK